MLLAIWLVLLAVAGADEAVVREERRPARLTQVETPT